MQKTVAEGQAAACPSCSKPYGARRRCYFCNGRPRTGRDHTCATCSKTFYVARWHAESPRYRGGLYCSVACKNTAMRGRALTEPGMRYVNDDGYVMVRVGIRKFELEHRLIMQRVLGRELATDEHVHHINHDKTDNRALNLVVLSPAEHAELHARERVAA